ncbi:MAG: DUF4384 domain-containing protein, partial [Thermodesulfobacteriota bacterium]
SNIVEAAGRACMGENRSKKQTELLAFGDAKRTAIEYTSTHISSETVIEDFELKKDLIKAYSKASVRVISEIERLWYNEDGLGDCFRVKILAEVMPEEELMNDVSERALLIDKSTLPLNIEIWTDKKTYKLGEKMRVYLKANKSFYGRLIYVNASGETLQILPNPYRKENHLESGIVYEIPSVLDSFDFVTVPPFGEETVTVYGSSAELGEIEIKTRGGVYKVETASDDIGTKTRGVRVSQLKQSPYAEFSESSVKINTVDR